MFILTCLKLSHLQSTLHLMQYTYRDIFSTAQNSFWSPPFWFFSVLLPYFVSPLLDGQNISLWGLFSSGKQKKSRLGKIRWIGRVGTGVMPFWVKNWGTFSKVWASVGRCTCKSLIMKGANALSLQKQFTEARCSLSQQCQLVHWYRWVPRTLT